MNGISRKLSVGFLSLALTLGILASWSIASGHRRPACCWESLPYHNYQTGVTGLRGTLASYPAATPVTIGARMKRVFDPKANELVVGDCSLSQIGLVLYSDGTYTLSFRAANAANNSEPNQSPDAKARAAPKKKATAVETVPVRHHRLRVTVRFYAGPGAPAAEPTKRAEGILLAQYPSSDFLVTAGEVRTLTYAEPAAGVLSVLAVHFQEITQAEFELEVDPEFGVHAKRDTKQFYR